ncbi:hypothetical protein Tco_0924699 [Tanacetum coccineum]|uniref:Uncharacterized protein n=1 Tax=Tanacetum coccineum TaxID=301880 RepID=A0ABQ5D4Q7_9ASTR
MLGAAGVQIPKNNLDDMHSSREEDGTLETVKMDNTNITMEEYISLQEEKALSHGEAFNWQTATYGKREYCDNDDDNFIYFNAEFPAIILGNTNVISSQTTQGTTMIEYEAEKEDSKIEFPAIVLNDALKFEVTPSYEPTVNPLNESKIDFRMSFDESDDYDYTMIFDENSFSYKIISVNNIKTDSKNDNDKVNIPLPPSPEPEVSCSNDLDFFKDFENEFPSIVYNDVVTSKSNFLTEHIVSPKHIDELNNETSLSECDEKEQNILYFNDLFPFKIIYPDDSKSDRDIDDDKIDIEHCLGDLSFDTLPNSKIPLEQPAEPIHSFSSIMYHGTIERGFLGIPEQTIPEICDS